MKFDSAPKFNPDNGSSDSVAGQERTASKPLEEEVGWAQGKVDRTPKVGGIIDKLKHPFKASERRQAEAWLDKSERDLKTFAASVKEHMGKIEGEANHLQSGVIEYDKLLKQLEDLVGVPAKGATNSKFVERISQWLSWELSTNSKAGPSSVAAKVQEAAKNLAVKDYFAPELPLSKSEAAGTVQFQGMDCFAPGFSRRFPKMELGTPKLEDALAKAEEMGGMILVMTLSDAFTGESKYGYDWPKNKMGSQETYVVLDESSQKIVSGAIGKGQDYIYLDRRIDLYDSKNTSPSEVRSNGHHIRTAFSLNFDSRVVTPAQLRKEKEPIKVTLKYKTIEGGKSKENSEEFSGGRIDVQNIIGKMVSFYEESSRFGQTKYTFHDAVVELDGVTMPCEEFIKSEQQAA